jgi:hypothetical protein
MKRHWWCVSLALTVAASATAQDAGPAARLGLPRAAQSRTTPEQLPLVQPAAHSEATGIILPGLDPVPTGPPERLVDDPKPAPRAGVSENGTKELKTIVPTPIGPPVTAGPLLPPPIVSDDQLLTLPDNAPPFINCERCRFSAEYLMWWTKGYTVPALVTTGPATSDGILGQPGVSTVFGNGDIGSNFHSGARLGFVTFCGPCQRWGIDARYFFLSQSGDTTGFSSSGDPLLARPFFNLNQGVNSSEIVASPGVIAGGVVINTKSNLWGAEANLRRKIVDNGCCSIDGLLGYRYMSLTETLTIDERANLINPGSAAPGTVIGGTAFDRFRTINQFNGGQIGATFERTFGHLVLDLRSTVAFGVTSSTVDISGGQLNTLAGGTVVSSPGGLYALSSNIGQFHRSKFAVVPELNFNVGYNLTPHCRLFVGYSLIYWSNVLRPGDQIDQGLDVNRIANFPASTNTLPVARPTPSLNGRDYIAQGLNFGIIFRW